MTSSIYIPTELGSSTIAVILSVVHPETGVIHMYAPDHRYRIEDIFRNNMTRIIPPWDNTSYEVSSKPSIFLDEYEVTLEVEPLHPAERLFADLNGMSLHDAGPRARGHFIAGWNGALHEENTEILESYYE